MIAAPAQWAVSGNRLVPELPGAPLQAHVQLAVDDQSAAHTRPHGKTSHHRCTLPCPVSRFRQRKGACIVHQPYRATELFLQQLHDRKSRPIAGQVWHEQCAPFGVIDDRRCPYPYPTERLR